MGVKELRWDGGGIPRAGLSRGLSSVHQDLGKLSRCSYHPWVRRLGASAEPRVTAPMQQPQAG